MKISDTLFTYSTIWPLNILSRHMTNLLTNYRYNIQFTIHVYITVYIIQVVPRLTKDLLEPYSLIGNVRLTRYIQRLLTMTEIGIITVVNKLIIWILQLINSRYTYIPIHLLNTNCIVHSKPKVFIFAVSFVFWLCSRIIWASIWFFFENKNKTTIIKHYPGQEGKSVKCYLQTIYILFIRCTSFSPLYVLKRRRKSFVN